MANIVTQEASSAWSGGRLLRLKERCQGVLEQLAQVPGVDGACLCDNHGAVVGMLLPAGWNRRLFERIGLALCQCWAAMHARWPLKGCEVRFEGKVVVARDLGNALAVAVCGPDANLPILRMALNVAANPFETDAELQRDLAGAAPLRAKTLSRELDGPARTLLEKGGLKAV